MHTFNLFSYQSKCSKLNLVRSCIRVTTFSSVPVLDKWLHKAYKQYTAPLLMDISAMHAHLGSGDLEDLSQKDN